jgi:hypothetical protein
LPALLFISALQIIATGAFIAACINSCTLAHNWPAALGLALCDFAFAWYLIRQAALDLKGPDTGRAVEEF